MANIDIHSPTLVIQGDMRLIVQEGGHASHAIDITLPNGDVVSLDEAIVFWANAVADPGWNYQIGRVRVTVERVE